MKTTQVGSSYDRLCEDAWVACQLQVGGLCLPTNTEWTSGSRIMRRLPTLEALVVSCDLWGLASLLHLWLGWCCRTCELHAPKAHSCHTYHSHSHAGQTHQTMSDSPTLSAAGSPVPKAPAHKLPSVAVQGLPHSVPKGIPLAQVYHLFLNSSV